MSSRTGSVAPSHQGPARSSSIGCTSAITLALALTIGAFERVSASARLDPTFGNSGVAIVSEVPATGVTLQKSFATITDSTGRLIILGAGKRDGAAVIAAVRLRDDGVLDAAWGDGGVATIPAVGYFGSNANRFDAVVLDDDRIVVAAWLHASINQTGLFIFALSPDGDVIADFGPSGAPGFLDIPPSPDEGIGSLPAGSIERGPDGLLYVVARVESGWAGGPSALGRLGADGRLDRTFGSNGTVRVLADSRNLVIQPDGKFLLPKLIIGAEASSSAIVRLGSDGQPDLSFGEGGVAHADFSTGWEQSSAIAIDSGRIYLAGNAEERFGSCHACIAAFTPDGALDTDFNPGGASPGIVRARIGAGDVVTHLLLDAGRLVVSSSVAPVPLGPSIDFDFGFVSLFEDASPDEIVGGPGGVFTVNVGGPVKTADVLESAFFDSRHRLVLSGRSTPGFVAARVLVDAIAVRGTMSRTGRPIEGGAIAYALALRNAGNARQADNPGDELVDVLPSGLVVSSVESTSGAASIDAGTGRVAWNGALGAGESATITIHATIAAGTAGMTISNQATIAYDGDNNGTNETLVESDDPTQPGNSDPLVFIVIGDAILLDGFE